MTLALSALALGLALAGAPAGRARAQTESPVVVPDNTARLDATPLMLVDERLLFDWRIMGFRGVVAGLFLPNRGHAELSTAPDTAGRWNSELLLTADSRADEYWRYGAELDSASGRAVRVWSSYFYDGKRRKKEERLGAGAAADGQPGVIDVTSGILLIRAELPVEPRRLQIWSDGKIYPVIVTPGGIERRTLPGGVVNARRFTIEGVVEPGGRVWKGRLDLWLALDEAATPVEIVLERGWAGVRLVRAAPPRGAKTGGGS